MPIRKASPARCAIRVAHPTVPVLDGSQYILELDSARGGRANNWHTDVTFTQAYPQASILRAVTVPESGRLRMRGPTPRPPTRICRRN